MQHNTGLTDVTAPTANKKARVGLRDHADYSGMPSDPERFLTPSWARVAEVLIPPRGQPEAPVSARSARFHACQPVR